MGCVGRIYLIPFFIEGAETTESKRILESNVKRSFLHLHIARLFILNPPPVSLKFPLLLLVGPRKEDRKEDGQDIWVRGYTTESEHQRLFQGSYTSKQSAQPKSMRRNKKIFLVHYVVNFILPLFLTAAIEYSQGNLKTFTRFLILTFITQKSFVLPSDKGKKSLS